MKSKSKGEFNPEIIREREEKRKSEMLYSGEINRRIIFMYALFASTAYTAETIGFGLIVPPVLFSKLFD